MNAPLTSPSPDTFVDVTPSANAEPLFDRLLGLSVREVTAPPMLPSVAVGVLHGFDLQDRPLVLGVAALPGEILVARSTVALRTDMRGASVVLAFEGADVRKPIILGVLNQTPLDQAAPAPAASVRIDEGERLVLRAEREVVLECGEASITLTRGGKVLIRGKQILSLATGYNRIKGAAIDIN